MDTKTTRIEHEGGFSIAATITHEGRDFTAGGGFVSDSRLICYPKASEGWGRLGHVQTWEGTRIGTYTITGSASGFRDMTGRPTRLTCYRVRLDDGREYVGRGLGAGMILRCRRAAPKKGK